MNHPLISMKLEEIQDNLNTAAEFSVEVDLPITTAMKAFERALYSAYLKAWGNNITHASAHSSVHRNTFWRKLAEHEIDAGHRKNLSRS